MKKQKESTNKLVIYFGVVLVLIGFVLVFSDYFLSKKQKVYDEISFVLSEIPDSIDQTEVDPPTEEDEVEVQPTKPEVETKPEIETKPESYNFTYNTESTTDFSLSRNYYIGKLVISKINFAKGFAAQGTSQNSVDKNIVFISPSNYPDVTNGNFILAGHSGNSWRSFFRDLNKLVLGDQAEVYYKNNIYTYKLVNFYNQPKGSKLKIYRDANKTTMTLITCSMTDKASQTIFIFER